MSKIAILGDTHVPGRAGTLPEELINAIKKFSPERIWFTGDFTSLEVVKQLQALAPMDAVKGNADFLDLPETMKVEAGGLRFCLLHGNQVNPRGNREQLQNLCKYFECEAIVSGHSHILDIFKEKFIGINPGTATGVVSGGGDSQPPTMVLAEIENRKLDMQVLTLEGASLKRKKMVLEADGEVL